MKKQLLLLSALILTVFLSAQTKGTLTVTFTTATAGGGYAPENVIAVWVQNSSNQIQKTLLLNTNNKNSTGSNLTVWYAAIGSNFANRNTYKDVDGIAGATNSGYSTKNCYWGNTVNLNTVPNGTYTLKMEFMDGHQAPLNSTGHYVATYTFTKGTATNNGVLVGSLPPCFKNVSVTWVANTTGIDDVEFSKLYSVFPNPTIKSVYVNGPDIKNIEIFTLKGERVLFSNEQLINTSSLQKGTYIVNIQSSKGIVTKKLVKN